MLRGALDRSMRFRLAELEHRLQHLERFFDIGSVAAVDRGLLQCLEQRYRHVGAAVAEQNIGVPDRRTPSLETRNLRDESRALRDREPRGETRAAASSATGTRSPARRRRS